MKLFAHQERALLKANQHDSYALFMETGAGKTLVALSLIKARMVKTLVICPLSIIESVWVEGLRDFAPGLRVVNAWDYLRRKKPLPDADVYIINYESVKKLLEILKDIKFLVLDESTKIKNPRAQVTKLLLKLSKDVKYKLIMTGTPAPNNLLEYWPQMFFINPDILGPNFYVYRAVNFFNFGYGKFLWKPKTEFKLNIGKILSQQAFFIKKEDCLDLPEKLFQIKEYQMSAQQQLCYKQMLHDNITTIGSDTILGANQLAKIMKLRQITAGFAVDFEKKRHEISDGKLNLLKETIEEIGDKQVIIWCQFHWEIEKIKEILGDQAVCLYGKVKQSDREQNIHDFTNGNKKYLIAHPKSAGHGLNFTNCSYAIYFSLSYSFEEEKQSQDRCHRIGQRNRVTYIYLMAEKSIDGVIYRALRGKESMSDAVMRMINV